MIWNRVRDLMAIVVSRRTRWVEVSLTRAWSYDMPPRLFDLDER
jgi:hypothetical protein